MPTTKPQEKITFATKAELDQILKERKEGESKSNLFRRLLPDRFNLAPLKQGARKENQNARRNSVGTARR
jgi:hypothetical protein